MKRTSAVLLALFIATVAGTTFAATDLASAPLLQPKAQTKAAVQTAPTTVRFIEAYEEFGDGDVLFTVEQPSATCVGYWLKRADPGFATNRNLLLSARMSGTPVTVYAKDDLLWPGSGSPYCKVHALRL